MLFLIPCGTLSAQNGKEYAKLLIENAQLKQSYIDLAIHYEEAKAQRDTCGGQKIIIEQDAEEFKTRTRKNLFIVGLGSFVSGVVVSLVLRFL